MSKDQNYGFIFSLIWPLLDSFLGFLMLWASIPVKDGVYENKSMLHFCLTASGTPAVHTQSVSFPITDVFKDLWVRLQIHFIVVHFKHSCLHKPLSSVLINQNDWRWHWIIQPAVYQGTATDRVEASKAQSEIRKEIKVKDLGGWETYNSILPAHRGISDNGITSTGFFKSITEYWRSFWFIFNLFLYFTCLFHILDVCMINQNGLEVALWCSIFCFVLRDSVTFLGLWGVEI